MPQDNVKTVTIALVKSLQHGREVYDLYEGESLAARFMPIGIRPGYWLVDASFKRVMDSSKALDTFAPYVVLDESSMVPEFLRALAQGDIGTEGGHKAQAEHDKLEQEFLARQW